VAGKPGAAYPATGQEGLTMTESEWLTSEDPTPMLECLRGKVSDRKLRLFACACVRRVWRFLDLAVSRRAVEVTEQFADGEVSASDREDATEAAYGPVDPNAGPEQTGKVQCAALAAFWAITDDAVQAADAAADAVGEAVFLTGDRNSRTADDACQAEHAERAAQCHLVRDVFGLRPGSAPTATDAALLAWDNGAIPALARSIYDDRALDRLPILADALEDAGCADRPILDHCRGPGPHCRGCWVVDLVLGKS
jgi:hypothetical protein